MRSGFLLDTNVISETVRKQPDARVLEWLNGLASDQLYVSVLSLGEIRKGALMVKDARRRQRLLHWLQEVLPAWFEERVLPIDLAVAQCWGQLLADAGRPLPSIDSLLAATALQTGLTLATRNMRDFTGLGADVMSPWEGS